ncbi:MAG: DUF1028 domain-containing protein [Anaerolineae bacterium]|jgi:uncharacterized Ntn-hydrolase superfamily protein|nr:DUF1028 domain-containing protein [Anaerolineae bacterium]
MTYSIVARDAATGEIGVAVETALPGVGRTCPWAEAGVGAVATQALSRKSHGSSGLTLMRNGHTAPEALAAAVSADAHANVRQIGMVDAKGHAAAHTGTHTIRYAGHRVGEGFAVQANMMLNDTVPSVMAAAFESASGNLAQRIIAALKAAQEVGGDFRGQQSAALKIVSGTLPTADWEGVIFDVRVDDHPEPVLELERIFNREYAYKITGEAEELVSKGDLNGAIKRYEEAMKLDPNDSQIRFWYALNLADEGHFDHAEPIFRELFTLQPMWVECAIRYAESNPLKTEGLLKRITALAQV